MEFDSVSPVIGPKLLEQLSHPLRQKILILIEKEGNFGLNYKKLKQNCKVATGTLYHHLRVLKGGLGLITQNSEKKYVLTQAGIEALDFIFQEKSNLSISIENNITPKITKIQLTDKKLKTSKLSLYQLFHLHPLIYYVFFGLYLISGTVVAVFSSQMPILFFSFLPLQIQASFPGFLPLIWLLLTAVFMTLIGLSSKQHLSLASWGWLFFYHSLIALLTVTVYILPFLQSDTYLILLSYVLQILFLVFWTAILISEFWSWEKSLISGLIINYLLLLVPL